MLLAAVRSLRHRREGAIELRAATDLFTVGVVLYELACGKRPFDGGSDAATLKRLVEGRKLEASRLQADLPEPLARIVLRALELEPARRYASAREMEAALRTYLAEVNESVDSAALGKIVRAAIARAGDGEPTPTPVVATPTDLAREAPTRVDRGAGRSRPRGTS